MRFEHPPPPSLASDCRCDERGGVSAEYLVLLAMVSVGACAGLAAAGMPLVRMFVTRQIWLLLPFP